jgi:hypothetical protein
MRRRGALALTLLLLLLGGCAGLRGSDGAPLSGGVEVDAERVLSLERRVEGFYLRLAHRRFDTLETYNDYIMRDHFRSLDLFFDYYADLAEDLSEGYFDRCRPTQVELLEFSFEDRDTALVRVRFEGEDGRPLRPGTLRLVRIDRWEYADGVWWLRPGKV